MEFEGNKTINIYSVNVYTSIHRSMGAFISAVAYTSAKEGMPVCFRVKKKPTGNLMDVLSELNDSGIEYNTGISSDGSAVMSAELTGENLLWDEKHPNMFVLESNVSAVAKEETVFGIRSIKKAGEVLEINGIEISPVKDVFFDAEILSDIDDKRKMRNHVEAYKEKGCNYIDALDDQLSEALFIATDEAGVYVDVNVHMDDVSTEETLKDRVMNILSLYGNHPSLIRLLITGYVNDNENIDEFMDSFIKKDPRHLYEVEL